MNKIKTLPLALILLLCLGTVMTACGESDSESEVDSVTSIRLLYKGAAIPGNEIIEDFEAGKTLTFTADVQVTGKASKDFTITSSSESVASISGKTVTIITAGQTLITATAADDENKRHAIRLYIDDSNYVSDDPVPYFITNNFAEDSSTAFLVQWHNDVSMETQTLQIVKEESNFMTARNITVNGELFEATGLIGEFEARNIFKTEVSGLSPATRYKYRVGSMGAWSDIFYHTTSGGPYKDFSFTVVSDPQAAVHTQMVETLTAANAFDPDNRFFVMCGDIVNEIGRNPAEIASYTNAANEINKERPIAATQGNHDTYYKEGSDYYKPGNAKIFNAFVTFPENGWDQSPHAGPDRSKSYYFYYNDVLVIMLNTFATDNATDPSNTATTNFIHTKQIAWLQEILDADRAEGRSKYTIIATHGPLFSARNGELDRYPATTMRANYGKLCADYGVDIFFGGHDHVYARTDPIKIGSNTATAGINFNAVDGGTVYSIVGATGPKMYQIAANVDLSPYYKAWFSQPSDASPGIFVNVKVTEEKLIVTARVVDKSDPIDTYEVPAK